MSSYRVLPVTLALLLFVAFAACGFEVSTSTSGAEPNSLMAWLVRSAFAQAGAPARPPAIPDEATQVRLAQETMGNLFEGIRNRSLATLHRHASQTLQRQ